MVSGRHGPAAGDLVEVELDDDASPARRSRQRTGRVRRRRWSARAWSRVAVPLALVLAVGVGIDGAVAAGLAHPRAGLVADLRVPRDVAWHVPAGRVLGVLGDTVVMESAGRRSVVARDLRDGGVVWSADVTDCWVADASEEPETTRTGGAPRPGLEDLPAADARLVCAGSADPAHPEDAPTVLVDAADGAVLGEFDGTWNVGVLAGDGALVVVSPAAGDGDCYTAASLRTGAELWSVVGPGRDSVGLDIRGGALVLVTSAEGRTAVVTQGTADPDRDIAYDLRTGARVDVPPSVVEGLLTLSDGTEVRTAWDTMAVTATAADGTVLWEAPGLASGFLLRAGAREIVPVGRPGGYEVDVRDGTTGAVLWTTDTWLSPLGDVAGVLVAAVDVEAAAAGTASPSGPETVELRGLDPLTGRVLWAEPMSADTLGSGSLVSDGARFALLVDGALEARDARTGAVVARWPLPASSPGTAGSTTYTVNGTMVITSVPVGLGSALTRLPDGWLLVRQGRDVAVLGW
jgi:hypothetical protein